MDAAGVDGVARWLAGDRGRRALVGGLAGALAAAVVGHPATAARHKKPRKAKVCLNGRTIKASRNKKKKLLKRGATAGACGGACRCTGDAVCHDGTCRACTVTCAGSDVNCGLDLSLALEEGGEIFVCPGRYAGTFTITVDGTTLVGAGPGEDPATNTILDGRGNGSVVTCDGQFAAFIGGVRITGGEAPSALGGAGGGIAAMGTDLQVDNFSIVDNRAQTGAGIVANQRLRLSNGTIERNEATQSGGGIFLLSLQSSSIRNVYIANNEAPKGGGVFHTGTKLTILGCETSENRASDKGGGFYHQLGTLTFDDDCRVVENTAGDTGGGIFVEEEGTVQPNGAEIDNNTPNDCSGATAC